MLQPGDLLLGKYRIESLIGRGAFAEVYRATHLTLRVPRALKILRRDAPGIGSTEFGDYRGRFEQEAQLGARLNSPTPHPHLIQVHDFHAEGELMVLEMEYAPGGSLTNRLAPGGEAGRLLAVDEAVRIALDVAQGLAALHGVDAVHRDLKPSNILFDSCGRAKVADLGLAQVPGGASQRSLGGSLALPHPGTPGYKSPEQEQTTRYLKPASDIYSLGVVLFEMLTARSYPNLKPGTRLSKYCPAAPGWLDALAARMLADDPAARPWDGEELAEALAAGLAEAEATAKVEAKPEAEQRRLAQEAEQERQREAEARRQAEVKAQAELTLKAELAAQAAEQARLRREAEAREAEAKAAAQAKAEAAEQARQAEVKRQQEAAEAAKQQPIWQRIGIELVKIPAGDFLYGEDMQKVRLPEYHIAKTPVTNAQYKVFVDASVYRRPSHWQGGQIPAGKENHPVVNVSWEDAQKFCAWAGLRLPSEAEWEKAARGTDGREYPWGAAAPTDKLCNFNYKIQDTTPVGRYSPAGDSPYGLVDMAGNLWEWCADWSDSEHKSRVLRSGSFGGNAQHVRCAFRLGYDPVFRDGYFGFRVVSPGL